MFAVAFLEPPVGLLRNKVKFIRRYVKFRRKSLSSSFFNSVVYTCRPGSVVSIATGYGLDVPVIESRWGEIYRTCPDRPWGPPSLLYNGYRVFPRG
jgi:hypothetical protein